METGNTSQSKKKQYLPPEVSERTHAGAKFGQDIGSEMKMRIRQTNVSLRVIQLS